MMSSRSKSLRRKKLESKTVALIRKLPEKDLRALTVLLESVQTGSPESESRLNAMASEQVLAKDWLSASEDKAWAHL